MDILIVTNFCSDFSATDNDRFLYLARMLSKEHNVEIVTSDFCHEKKSHRNTAAADWSPIKITFLSEPGYKKNICLKRFYSHIKWGKSLKKYLAKREKPDVIYCAVPSLSGPSVAAKYCEKNGVKFVIDVQDLWPEAFKMVFNVPVLSKLIFLPFEALANGIYKRADSVCAVSDTYVERALRSNKKCNSGHSVFLGTDLSNFDRNIEKTVELEKNDDEIWLAYCGTLGSSYDLTTAFDALAKLKNDKIKFIVMGDGPKMQEFKDYSESLGLNVHFTGRIPYDQMCATLAKCDININPISHGAAQSIINKHADYAASGNPVISTQENREYRELVESFNMGYNCSNGDSDGMAKRIAELAKNRELREEMGKNARKCAEQRFDRRNSYGELVSAVLE